MSVNIETVIDEAIALCRANPAFVYRRPDPETQRCFYVFDNEPSCLFGQALVKAGVPVEVLRTVEDAAQREGGNTSLSHILDDLQIEVTTSWVNHYLAQAQMKQDTGTPWGGLLHDLTHAKEALE